MEKKDWTILALAAAHGQPLSPVQLQKTMFLIGQNLASDLDDRFYAFLPYNYGPFSSAVYSDCEEMQSDGLVSIEQSTQGYSMYSATAKGITHAERIEQEAGTRGTKYVAEVVHWTMGLSFSQLVRSIYAQFPDYRTNSIFRF